MVADKTFDFERRRDVVQPYDRIIMAKTIRAIQKVQEVRQAREERFYKNRLVDIDLLCRRLCVSRAWTWSAELFLRYHTLQNEGQEGARQERRSTRAQTEHRPHHQPVGATEETGQHVGRTETETGGPRSYGSMSVQVVHEGICQTLLASCIKLAVICAAGLHADAITCRCSPSTCVFVIM